MSAGSGVDPAIATAAIDHVLPEVISARSEITFFRLDDIQGAVAVGTFRTGNPARESRSAVAVFERDRLAEGKRSFLLLREALFSHPTRTSPLAQALSVMSADNTGGKRVHYVILGDARETVLADFECHPPSREAWLAALQQAGALQQGSLKNSTVVFVGVHPLQRVPGNRCRASLVLGQQARTLWQAAISQAGGSVQFQADPPPATAIVLMGAMLFWRKLRVKFRAWRDRKRGRYSPLAIILELLGAKPGLDPTDPSHEHALLDIERLRGILAESTEQLRSVRDELTQHWRWWHLAILAGLCVVAESVAWTIILRDGGVPSPERYLMGAMCGCFSIILIAIAAKHALDGRRSYLIGTIIVTTVIIIAATVIRVLGALTTGAGFAEELCIGILLSCAGIGPAITIEYLASPLRAVLPLARKQRVLTKTLHTTKHELEELTTRLSREARLRRAWECEYQILLHTYNGINPPPQEPTRTVLAPEHHGSQVSNGKVNGLPVWPD